MYTKEKNTHLYRRENIKDAFLLNVISIEILGKKKISKLS